MLQAMSALAYYGVAVVIKTVNGTIFRPGGSLELA